MAASQAAYSTKSTSKSSSTKSRKKSSTAKQQEPFIWTDSEVELLLRVTNDYKVAKSFEGVDWEPIQKKYVDILQRFQQDYPKTGETSGDSSNKDFPHKPSDITKIILSTKLKAIRTKYRQSVDSGKRSGHGRVVWIYFEMCASIWGGSPATTSIPSGIESSDVSSLDSSSTSVDVDSESNNTDDLLDGELLNPDSPEDDGNESEASTPKNKTSSNTNRILHERRELLNERLQTHKQEKLKRKLSLDSQFLKCAQEDLQFKKQVLDKMDHMEKGYSDNMKLLSTNVEKLTNSISDFFSGYKSGFSGIPQPYMSPINPQYHHHQQQIPTGYYNTPHLMNTSSQSNPNCTQFEFIDNDHGHGQC